MRKAAIGQPLRSQHAPRSMPTAGTGGFTLLELIVVMGIVALTATLVLPRLQSANARAGLQSATQQLAATLRLARAQVLYSGAEQTETLDPAGHLYWTDAMPGKRAIDPRLTLRIEEDGFEWAGQLRQIRFRPDGSATGGVIVLADGTARTRIAIDWLTGVTHLTLEP